MTPKNIHPDWLSHFDDRAQRLIRNCRQYAASDPAGVPGHQLMLIIAQMADMLSEAEDRLHQAEVEHEEEAGS